MTISRICLAPVFYIVFSIPEWTGRSAELSAIIMIILFAVMELSDLLDGIIARKYNMVTDLGKIMDPFADVMSRMTYFICFVSYGIMPIWILLFLFYRELGITFLRMYMIKKGSVMAASIWGKAKAVSYSVSGILGLFIIITRRLGLLLDYYAAFNNILFISLLISLFAALLSFFIYLLFAIKQK